MSPVYAELLRQAGFADVQAVADAQPGVLVAALSLSGVQPASLMLADAWVRRARELLGRPHDSAEG